MTCRDMPAIRKTRALMKPALPGIQINRAEK
jgi:hypothetical protein